MNARRLFLAMAVAGAIPAAPHSAAPAGADSSGAPLAGAVSTPPGVSPISIPPTVRPFSTPHAVRPLPTPPGGSAIATTPGGSTVAATPDAGSVTEPPTAGTVTAPRGVAGARSAAGIIALRAALEMVGLPYSWGGGGVDGPGYGTGSGARTWGFDCSGLTEYAWARAGVMIGSTTREQWRSGIRVPKELVEPGDLVFYDSDPARPGPEHVGLAVDATRIVDAPYTGANVRLDPLDRPHFRGVVRPAPGRPEPRT
ncbi:NlpC/P60 family protein [Nonomuraea pusilla]|uniref:C40 family peptidase n=1 Tax=Nonomuraea pusilla TaxID=46177 RepID=UPI00332CF15D